MGNSAVEVAVAEGGNVAVAEGAGVKVGTGAVEVGIDVAGPPQPVINNTAASRTDEIDNSFFICIHAFP